MDYIQLQSYIREQFSLADLEPAAYSPLTLAYIGDSIYDLVIKTVIIGRGNCPANKLHKKASALVRAEAQAKIADFLWDILTEAEQGIYKRGRNAKSYTMAKNASVTDYRKATGLEALVGYLYLANQTERVIELLRLGIEHYEGGNHDADI